VLNDYDGEIDLGKAGITFTYKDPVTELDDKEVLSGSLKYIVGTDKNDRVYNVDLTMRSYDTFYSNDTIFAAKLTGTISKSYGMAAIEGGQEMPAVVTKYNLNAENATKAQVVNFLNWWINCVMHSL
jgi:hypothetical protein